MGSQCMGFAVLLLSLLLVSPASLSYAKDTLELDGYIEDGETLISAGEIFELGFFSPGSSKYRYIGIWYYNFSTDTVLWVANREAPVHDTSGRLAVGGDGNLVVLNGSRSVLWSSNVSLSSNASTVQLLDDGNLVLNDTGRVAWQSFENPTDTYLPGMKVGLDLTTNVNQYITSWKSSDDPAPGNYSMGVDPNRSTQIFVWEGTKPRWRSGRWNGQVFIGIQNMVPTYIYGFKLSNFELEKKMYFYYNAFNSSHRYVLTWEGIEKHLTWKDDTKFWSTFWAQPITDCELYNKCGNYGSCTDENTPICSCLKGYVPAVEAEWSSGNWTSGCVRRTPLQCERNSSGGAGSVQTDGFWKMEGVKLPDLSDWASGVVDEDGCGAACLGNCSCQAYAYVTGIGCLVWGVDLVDIHIFSSGGNDMYLRLAASEIQTKKKKSFVILIVVLAVVLSLGCIYLFFKCKKRIRGTARDAFYRRRGGGGIVSVDPNRDRDRAEGGVSFRIPDESKDQKCQELPLFSFDSIVASTSNFALANLLGEGGFGPVYKGTLPGGQEVALKRLSRSSGQGETEFKNEVILMAKLQHRNLVRLLGCCIHGEERILVYEYMPNRSLNAFLFDPRKKGLLEWKTRYDIIEGIARGLLYLHRDSRLRIIHRDLKASNILLDKDMNPKISDFGMARIFGSDDNETNTKRVVGTYGYMSPEYAMQGVFSVKSDVYSFGVLLLEIVSGRKNSSFAHQDSSLNLLGSAWKLWNEDNVMEFVDPAIRDSCSPRQASRCVNVGLLCVQDRPNDRPTMSSVVIMLEGGTAAYPQPKQPTFSAERSPSDTESSTFGLRVASASNSITLLTAR
ncbi:G-type lectin S-receptor-like serine/threonine-protein kinase B120 isoform X1 [Musa acuminata AAA Group]|uniref:G-type lectin S-receptor-like serine/threonine-protein kinase B120 isoform X1 n=1 Tax=Musa acuminata AAA Group TaxID=214697 RepID=UPI0031DED4AE